MLNRTKVIAVLLLFLLLSVFALAVPKMFIGTITDTLCGKKHMIAGKSDAECTRECMKSKGDWTYGLVVGDKVYRLSGDTKKFDAFAGQQVKASGETSGTRIAVQTLSPATR